MIRKQNFTVFFVFSFIMLLFPLWSLAETGHLDFSQNPLAGRKVFVSKGCVTCHAVWGVGGTLGPDLVKVSRNRTFLEIVAFLWNHSPKMMATMEEQGVKRPDFTVEETQQLIVYLYYLNYFNKPGNFERGKLIFHEKGCSNCHSLREGKTLVGPSLARYQNETSPIAIAQALWNHGPKMAEVFRMVGLDRFTFSGAEIADILAYIHGASTDVVPSPQKSYLTPGNPERGKKLFRRKHCSHCHSTGTKRIVGPGLGLENAHRNVVGLAALMWNHGPVMWKAMKEQNVPFPKLSEGEMADLASYLYFLRFFNRDGGIRQGKRLFSEKHCAACHSLQGESSVGPNLARSDILRSPAAFATAIWNHAPVMNKLIEKQELPWPTFENHELDDILVYIESVRNRRPRTKK